MPSREGAQRRDVLRVVGERFRHDVAGACEHGLGRVVGAARLRIARRQRARVAVGRRLCDHEQRERFEPGVARLRGAGGALLPVRFVQVLHALHDGGFLDLRAQGVRELALLVDGAQHVGLARLERAQVGQPLVQVAQRHVVEAARGLLAVACDEGDRVPLVHQRDDVLDVRHGFRFRLWCVRSVRFAIITGRRCQRAAKGSVPARTAHNCLCVAKRLVGRNTH